MNLNGKVILITGASCGIGRALACGFVADGADVVTFDLQESSHDDTAHFLAVVGDVTSKPTWTALLLSPISVSAL
jgi:NAD(P)-dependent dehydrogenase (short-subunit alcohol dehydrogenase family)